LFSQKNSQVLSQSTETTVVSRRSGQVVEADVVEADKEADKEEDKENYETNLFSVPQMSPGAEHFRHVHRCEFGRRQG
jgi:hypothetical protein